MSQNTLRPRQNGRHFADDIFKWILLNENVWILIKISLTFVPKVSMNDIPTLVQVMAWRRPGDKPLSEAMTASLLTHICVTRPQWVKEFHAGSKSDTESIMDFSQWPHELNSGSIGPSKLDHIYCTFISNIYCMTCSLSWSYKFSAEASTLWVTLLYQQLKTYLDIICQ